MTRINLVPVADLYDQHLVAEYREFPMIGKALQRSLRTKSESTVLSEIPTVFTLNKGHVKFFYDKAKFLEKRYTELVNEMKARGYSPDPMRIFNAHDFPAAFWNDYLPPTSAVQISEQRIAERVGQKPDWYRMTKAVA